MEKKFRLHYGGEYKVNSFAEVNDWFLHSSAGEEVRYCGSYPFDKSAEWGEDWKTAYVVNYYSPSGSLYFDVAYCNFLEPEYIVAPQCHWYGTITYDNGTYLNTSQIQPK